MQQLSGQDSLFLYLETEKTPMHVGGVYIFDSETKTFDFEETKRFFEERLHLSRIFRQRLVEVPMDAGHPFWVEDPNFKLDDHISHQELKGEGKLRDLGSLCAKLFSQPLQRDRPLWEIVFITGLKEPHLSPNAFAMFAKIHHAAIDGGSGVEIMATILSMTEQPFVPAPPETPWKPERIPTAAELVAKSYGSALGTPKKLFQFVKNTAARAIDVKKELSENLIAPPPLPMAAPKTVFNTIVSGRKQVAAIDISLSIIKKIKNAVPGATVNDVLLSVCAGGLRKYLVRTGRLPMKNLVAMAPISVRQEEETGAMGNKISAMLVDLATNTADPLQRLREINANTRSSKTFSKAIPADQIMEFVPSQLAATAGRVYLKMGLSKLHNPFFNLVITNVPGPPIPLYLNGFKMKNIYGFGPVVHGLGLMVIIFSYAGNVSITVTSDEEITADVHELTEFMRESMNELYESTSSV